MAGRKKDHAAFSSEEVPRRSNSVSGDHLRSFIERVERLREEKSALADDERAVFAEAKSAGYTPRYIRAIVKLRTLPPSERQEDEAMMDVYMSAIGMTQAPPLFRAVGSMGVDTAVRESVIEALKLLAPDNGEIIVKCGGPAMRIWRDRDGASHAEEVMDPPPAASQGPARAPSPRSAVVRADVPDVDEDGAEQLGRDAARDDLPIIRNPFPWDDKRRARWDLGWRRGSGSDGMGPREDDE